jgi:glucose-1-phosphate thymidylyltransferase
MEKKGILLAGGLGTRFNPITLAVNKHFLPIYKKPLFYYPLSILMIMGIKNIQIVSDKNSISIFKKILYKNKLNVKFSYQSQDEPRGIVDGIIKSKRFINKSDFIVILGDNFFYGQALSKQLKEFANKKNAIISVKTMKAREFGVIKFKKDKIEKILEKPKKFVSNSIVTGLYAYENTVIDICKNLKPSSRGELEITDLNNLLIKKNKLEHMELGRGSVWLDAGKPDDLLNASEFVRIIEKRSGFEVANLQEISDNFL